MIFSLPFPVSVQAAAEVLELSKLAIWDEERLVMHIPYFVLQILNARDESVYTSAKLTRDELTHLLYNFNTPVPVLKWKMRLDMYLTSRGKDYHRWKIFTINTDLYNPKGKSRHRVTVNGNSSETSRTANNLRTEVSTAVKRDGAEKPSGFSKPSGIRPNESVLQTRTTHDWLRFGHTGTMNNTPGTTNYVKRSRTWTGVRTPGFGSLDKGQLPVNPHTVSMRRTQNGPLIRGAYNVSNGNTSGHMGIHTKYFPGAILPVHLASAGAMALQRLVNKTGDRQNIAETLATANQTRDMVIGNIRRIVHTARALKDKNFSGAVKMLWQNENPRYRRRGGPKAGNSLASNWLELQYGWKPLIDDVHWALKALGEVNLTDRSVVRTTSSARKTSETKTFVAGSHTGAGSNGGFKTIKTTTTCKYVIHWQLTSHIRSLLQQAGFTNPVSLAWELLPFSFVADWFLRIGPFLEQLSAFEGYTFLRGSKTQFTKQWTTFAISYEMTSPLNANQRNWERSYYHDEWILLGREKLTSFPSAQLMSPRNGLTNVSRVANAMALLRQTFK